MLVIDVCMYSSAVVESLYRPRGIGCEVTWEQVYIYMRNCRVWRHMVCARLAMR